MEGKNQSSGEAGIGIDIIIIIILLVENCMAANKFDALVSVSVHECECLSMPGEF